MRTTSLFIVTALSATIALTGCSSSSQPQATTAEAPPPMSKAPVSTAPSMSSSSQPMAMSESSGEMATVYIYRSKSFMGMALKPTVMLAGEDLVNITNGRYFKGTFAAGKHLFQMDDKKSGAELDLKPGDVHYFRVEIVPGVFKGGGRMTLVAKEQGSVDILQLKPVDADQILNSKYR